VGQVLDRDRAVTGADEVQRRGRPRRRPAPGGRAARVRVPRSPVGLQGRPPAARRLAPGRRRRRAAHRGRRRPGR
jgi:hypothetical protein